MKRLATLVIFPPSTSEHEARAAVAALKASLSLKAQAEMTEAPIIRKYDDEREGHPVFYIP